MSEALAHNHFEINREDMGSFNPDDLQLSNSIENILKEFRTLDCSVCARHFGYQNRWDPIPKILLCSPRCLSVANNKVKSLPPDQRPFARHLSVAGTATAECKEGVTGKLEGSTDVPRPVQQGFGNPNQVNIEIPRINSRDANGYNDQRYSEVRVFRDKEVVEGWLKGSNNTTIRSSVAAAPIVKKEPQQVEAPVPKPPVEESASTWKKLQESPKETGKKMWTNKDLILSLSLVNMAPCRITFSWSPTKLTLVALADDSKLKKFQEDLNAYCSQAPPMTRVPSVGDILFALYSGEYYRARVDKVNAGKKYSLVTFIDFGDTLGVEFSDCRDPDDELMMNNPVYGVIFNTSLNVECPENLEICEELLASLDMETYTLQIESQCTFEFTGKLYLDEKRTWNEILERQIIANNPAAAKASSIVRPSQLNSPSQQSWNRESTYSADEFGEDEIQPMSYARLIHQHCRKL